MTVVKRMGDLSNKFFLKHFHLADNVLTNALGDGINAVKKGLFDSFIDEFLYLIATNPLLIH